ncbi:hypothetical protein F4818DRAFT_396893 [Hypoxylon cercidicola]|nr:hypothetical protein F4818DRAFT_396893 [Hypoxylon cercidicola]
MAEWVWTTVALMPGRLDANPTNNDEARLKNSAGKSCDVSIHVPAKRRCINHSSIGWRRTVKGVPGPCLSCF